MRKIVRGMAVAVLGVILAAGSVQHAAAYNYGWTYDYGYGYSSVQVNENGKNLVMQPGESYQITYSDASQVAAVTYTSNDPAVAVVSATGAITVTGVGQTYIQVTGTDISGYAISGTVYIYVPQVTTPSILQNLYGETAYQGYYTLSSLEITNVPGDAVVSVISSAPGLVAAYQKGFSSSYVSLKASAAGSYTITIMIGDKLFTVPVVLRELYFDRHEKSAADLESYNADKSQLRWMPGYSMLALYKGESAQLRLNGTYAGESVSWSSSNPAVASVNAQGKVKAKGNGSATITAAVGEFTLTYEVGVSYKMAIKALRYDIEHFGSTYSQAKRMQDGYYDCSSFVWRAYRDAGKLLNKNGGWAPTAADLAKWCVANGYMMYEGDVSTSKLLPGDLVFECDASGQNGRYKGIYHVDMYQGNGTLITVERQKNHGDMLYEVMVARPCSTAGALTAKKSGKSIRLSWSGEYGANGYKVYRSTKKNGKYKAIATVKNGTVYRDTKAKKGQTYYYKVRSYWKMNGHTYYGKYTKIVGMKA